MVVHPYSHRVSRVRRYSGYSLSVVTFVYGTLTLCGWLSHAIQLDGLVMMQVRTPEINDLWFGLLRVRSPLLAESRLMSFPRPTEMFQFRRFPTYTYLIQCTLIRYCRIGFPHSEISGSMRMCRSPKLIAACHVLRRLLMPRHSPCALISLTYIS